MLRFLATALLASALLTGSAAAQVLDETMVPRGQLRLQAHPTFSAWDSRFGRAADGTEREEELASDLTDSMGVALFPGIRTMADLLEGVSGTTGYAPGIGATAGRMTQNVTRIDFGGHLGVFDWLTIGVVVPWMRTRSAVDVAFRPDSLTATLGINPTLTDPAAVSGYLGALGSAAASADAYAASACAGGPSATCTSAQALASRATGFRDTFQGAYAASPFFPLAGTPMATALAQAAASLDVDLTAAGLSGIILPVAVASQLVTNESFRELPVTAGAGIEGSRLAPRTSLWQTGDVEVSALLRLLELHDSSPETGAQPIARLVAGFVVRLPTGIPEDPDVFLDLGHGDGQTDLEGRLSGWVRLGRLSLAAGGRYGVQRETTVTKRIAAPEVPMPPLSTRAEATWRPGSYLGIDVAPSLRLTEELWLVGEYRYFQKDRDELELLQPGLGLDPMILTAESGVKAHRIGGGLRFGTVEKWAAGRAPTPFELHLRSSWFSASSA